MEERHIIGVQENEDNYVVTFAKPDMEDDERLYDYDEERLEVSEEQEERLDREDMKTRGMMFDAKVVDEEKRTVRMAVSSEEPVDRSFGKEVLDHNERSIDLAFAKSGRMPLLLDHDPRQQIGVVEDVNLDGSARRLRATVRFGRNGLAKEVFDDVVDGIRSNISVGYHVNSMVEDGEGSYRVDNWHPMEVSVVSIPADRTVGVGRAAEQPPAEPIVKSKIKETTMTEEVQVDVEAVRADAARAAAKDTAEMYRLAAKHNKRDMADAAVAEGRSLAEFRGELLEAIGNQPLDTQEIGLTKKEVRNFSLMKAIRAMANPTDRNAQAEAEFEFETSREAAKRAGVDPQGLYMPMDVMRSWSQRDLNTSDDSAMVAEAYRGGAFIAVLRNASSVMQAGATMLTGLQGDVKIPKKTAASTAAAAAAPAPAPAATPATPAPAATPASASYIPASHVTREADGSTSGMDLTGNTWKPDSEKRGSTDTGDYFPEGYDPSQEVAFSVGMEGSQGFGQGDRGPQLPGMENLGEDALLMGGIEENSEIPDGMEFTMSSVPDGQVSMQVGSTSKGAEITIQVKPVCMGYEDYFAAFTADSHPSFSVSPCAGRMDRRGGETTDLTIKCVPAGQSGDLVGNLVINLPEDNSKICYVVTAQSF